MDQLTFNLDELNQISSYVPYVAANDSYLYDEPDVAANDSKITESKFALRKTYGSFGFDKVAQWLIKNFMPASASGVLYGQSMSFKTFTMVDVACSVATGKKFGGIKAKQGIVYIIAAEGASGITKRIKAWELQKRSKVGEKLIVVSHAIVPTDVNQRSALIADMKYESERQKLPVALVIFDTMSQCSNGMNENDAGAVSHYLQACREITEPLGATVLNVHHSKKDSDDFRGSSTILSNVDFLMFMKRHDMKVKKTTLKLEKMKEGSIEPSWVLTLIPRKIGCKDEDGKQVQTLCVNDVKLVEKSADNEIDKPAKQYAHDKDVILAYVKGHNAPVSLASIYQAMSEKCGISTDDPKLKTRVNRAKKYLLDNDYLIATKEGKNVYVCIKPEQAA